MQAAARKVVLRPWGAMHCMAEGPVGGPKVVFATSLGTDLRLWDAVLPLLPPGLRLLRYDKPGHGLSDVARAVSIAGLAGDAAALIADEGGGPAVFVGLSIGGLTGQALAAHHPGLLRGLVLSNTAPKIGTPESWGERIAAVNTGGLGQIADAVLERWFPPAFRARPELVLWRNMLMRSPVAGYVAACAAIAAADQTVATAGLRLPVLVIGGTLDGSTPPDLIRATAAMIPGAVCHMIEGAGHLPPVDAPGPFAARLTEFLRDIGHL